MQGRGKPGNRRVPGPSPSLVVALPGIEFRVPRFLVADRPELWRRLADSPLRRDGVEIVMARTAEELARLARSEAFDAVLITGGAGEADALERALESFAPGSAERPRLVAWEAAGDAPEVARRLGIECRRLPRSMCALRVEAEGFRTVAKDASEEGMFLPAAPDLPEGTRIEASLRAPGRRRGAQATLVVVRRVSAPEDSHRISGLGVRVLPAAPADAALLRSWLRSTTDEKTAEALPGDAS